MKNYLSSIIFIVLIQGAFAQNTEKMDLLIDSSSINSGYQFHKGEDIKVITKCNDKGYHFRWAPTNVTAWTTGKYFGYILEKRDNVSNEFVAIKGSPFKPWKLEDLEKYASDAYPYVMIAAQSIYGESDDDQGFVKASNELINRHTFNLFAADMDRTAAEVSGLYYFEADTIKGNLAEYRIYAIDNITNTSTDTTYFMGGYYGLDVLVAPEAKISEGDGALTIRWTGGGDPLAGTGFTAYDIERSSDGNSFTKINDQFFLNANTRLNKDNPVTTFIDSIENGTTYHYRIVGIDAFGDKSEASNVVKGTAKDLIAPNAAIISEVLPMDKSDILVNWVWNDANLGNDLLGFNVYHSATSEPPFKKLNNKILNHATRTYKHEKVDNNLMNYYYVETVDLSGNVKNSAVTGGYIEDDIPPAPPANLRVEMDSSGLVLLEWDAPADLDVMGYEIFKANHKDFEFIKENKKILMDEFYVDSITLKTLTKELYYKVVAVDRNFNRSDLSEMVMLTKIDTIAPVASIFKDYEVKKEGIYFDWVASTSNDVESIELFRRSTNTDWAIVDDFDPSKNNYLDSDVKEGVTYEYNLVTTDNAANSSEPASSLLLEALKSQFISDITKLKLKKKDEHLILSWEYPAHAEHRFIIYKMDDEGDLTMLKKLEGVNSFTMRYNESAINSYAIKAKGPDGRVSRMSELVSVE